jgi:glycine/D-amino acid oxidase-like deaminating enzyme
MNEFLSLACFSGAYTICAEKSSSMPGKKSRQFWGEPPWQIRFQPRNSNRQAPRVADFVVIGGGFTGLAAAARLRRVSPQQSVVVLEASCVGGGASGRTGGMALSETAAGRQPGLGDVLAGLRNTLETHEIKCDLDLRGAWEIARNDDGRKAETGSPIEWQDTGTLRVVNEVPGGTLDPGKLVSGLAHAADRAGARILENHRVLGIRWRAAPEIEFAAGDRQRAKITAGKIIFATNALSLANSGLQSGMHPRLTLAVLSAPITKKLLEEIGLGSRKPFYTTDFPYLWGRVRRDRSIVWGAGLVHSPDSNDLEAVDITDAEPARMFAQLEGRVRHLHPALAKIKFTHRWGGPILFRDSWKPVFDWHPRSGSENNAIVAGAYAGHGVALSSYLGEWAADVLAGEGRSLPPWGRIDD